MESLFPIPIAGGNIRDMLNPAGTSAPGALPLGHPPVKPQANKQDQTWPQKPR